MTTVPVTIVNNTKSLFYLPWTACYPTGSLISSITQLPFTPGSNSVAAGAKYQVQGCAVPGESVAGHVFWPSNAASGDIPIAWYFYDYTKQSVVAVKQSSQVWIKADVQPTTLTLTLITPTAAKVTLTNKSVDPLYYVPGGFCPPSDTEAKGFTSMAIDPSDTRTFKTLAAGASFTAGNACTVPTVGSVLYSGDAQRGDKPVAWYYYDYLSQQVVTQQSGFDLSFVVVAQTGTSISLEIHSSRAWLRKFWWLFLLIAVLVAGGVVALVLYMRRGGRKLI